MNYQERIAEAEKLKRENQTLLSTPLMSEGSISPMQVGLFSARQKARWQKDAMGKMELEHTIKQLCRTNEEIARDEARIQANCDAERLATIAVLQSKIGFIDGLGVMSHRKDGKLKPTYQRTINGYNQEIKRLTAKDEGIK